LQTVRYGCFVLVNISFMLITAAAGSVTAYLLIFGDRQSTSDLIRVASTAGLTAVSGGWQWLARREQENLLQHQEREMQLLRFRSEEDQRKKDNAIRTQLWEKFDLLPEKTREKLIAECLSLLPGKARPSRISGNTATA
jgi:hypothetical protein